MKVKNLPIFLGGLVFVLLGLVGWVVLFVQQPKILLLARLRFNQAAAQKIDLTAGPCLGVIAPDWVLDIAHLPRQPIDDLPQNQCADYRSGRVRHFVEMTPKGEVITVQ